MSVLLLNLLVLLAQTLAGLTIFAAVVLILLAPIYTYVFQGVNYD